MRLKIASAIVASILSSSAFADGLSSTGGLSASGGGSGSLTVGTSSITGTCTNGYLLYNNAGVLGCEAASGASTITPGTTGFSGTAGLLYGASSLIQSLPTTITVGSGANGTVTALGNNVQIALTSDGTVSNAAELTLIDLSTTGGFNNLQEFYSNIGSTYSLNTYINNVGIYYSTLDMVVSGHYSAGSGAGGHYGSGFAILPPNTYYPFMYAGWSDITGAVFNCRNNVGTSGELCLAAQDHNGVFKLGIDPENSQFIWGNTTISGAGQVFTGDTFLARAAAANIRHGGADAAAPVAQTISFQNVVAGTSNTAGVNTTIAASAGTGTGAGGSLLFNVAPAGTTGTTQNSFSTALTIAPTIITIGAVTSTSSAPQLVLTPASGNAWGLSSYFFGGGNLVFSANNSGTSGSWINEMAMNSQIFELQNVGGFCYSSTSNPTAGTDLCLWRGSAGAALLGNGTLGDYSGSLKLTSLLIANATSGAITVSAPAGALGSVTATIPDNTGTLAELNLAETWTGTQTLNGTSSTIAAILANAAEPATNAGAISSPLAFYFNSQSVYWSTTAQTANWTVNFAFSSGTSLNTAMTTGQTITAVLCALQGGTAYYNNVVQIDGTSLTSGTNLFWQGGTAPSAGNASGYDCYAYTILKTGSATYIVLATQTQF